MKRIGLFLYGLALCLFCAACEPAGVGPVDGPNDTAPSAEMTRPDPKPESVTTAMIQQKQVVCTRVNMYNLCDKWTWVSPDGFFDCAGDFNTYDGEITLHGFVNFTEVCVWARPNMTTHAAINDATMRDWDCNTGAGNMCPTYLVSKLHGGGVIFSGTSYTGSYQSWLGPLNGGPATTSFYPSFAIKSLSVNN